MDSDYHVRDFLNLRHIHENPRFLQSPLLSSSMRVFHSKHQKLILQCYPPGKGVDKKPNPLELSYLLYYASTRRVKLQKVIDFLIRKTKSDARGNKSGNLLVTLSIVSALIDKCADNLNVFALQVCTILTLVLNTGELPLCKSLVATYGVLCSKLDGGLFTGDKEFVNTFTRLTDSVIDVGVTKLKSKGPNQREWMFISLLTSRHVFNCLGFNAAVSHRFVAKCVPLLSSIVRGYCSYDTLLTQLNSNLNVEKDDRRVSRMVTTTTQPMSRKFLDDESLTEADLNEEALHGLEALFSTSLSSQVNEATIEVVESNFKDLAPDENSWGTTFLEMCASWIPVQLRFVALSTLLAKLSVLADQLPSQESSYPYVVHYAQSILGLVSSNFNMIGLSITDILQQLLTLQTTLYLRLAQVLTESQLQSLSGIFSQCICNLSSHIYYFDQVLDSIVAILLQIDNVLLSSSETNVTLTHDLVLTFLDTISTVLNLLSRKLSTITRNHATLENWELSFLLLAFFESYREFALDATPQQIANIQTKYLTVFNQFLTTELAKGDEKSEENFNSPAATTNFGKLLAPNYNGYIDSGDNPLSHLLNHCDAFFEEQSFDLFVARLLLDTLKTLVGITGINFCHNFIPVFCFWQLVEVPESLPKRARDTTAYLLLEATLTVLDEKYHESIPFDVRLLTLASGIEHDIAERRKLDMWVGQMDGTNSDGAPAVGEFIPSLVTKKTLIKFSSQTKLLMLTKKNTHAEFPNSGTVLDGNLTELSESSHSQSTEEVADDSRLAPQSNLAYGLGLGSANDISSIHSGFVQGYKSNGHHSPDVTEITSDTIPTFESNYAREIHNNKHSLVPRVSDLKLRVNDTALVHDRFDLYHFTTERSIDLLTSVLERHVVDGSSIIKGLRSDDDAKIVV